MSSTTPPTDFQWTELKGVPDLALKSDPRFTGIMDQHTNICRSVLPRAGAVLQVTSGRSYFVYLGRLSAAVVIKRIAAWATVGGLGTQAAEVGMYSSPVGPRGIAETLTRLWAKDDVNSLLSEDTTVPHANGTDNNVSINADTHVYAAIRVAMLLTQPIFAAVSTDWRQGFALTATGTGSLTSSGGASISADLLSAFDSNAPDLWAVTY